MKDFFKDRKYKAGAILSIFSITTLLIIFAASSVSNNYHAVYATGKNATQTTSSSTAKTKESALFVVDVPTLIAAVAAAAALGGVFWGIYQYRQGQAAKRQEVLFLLVKDFNESKDLNLAKEILGYDHLRKTEETKDWQHIDEPHYYSVDKLGEILKSDKERSELSSAPANPEELAIRYSFDNFIVFLGKIGYSLKVGAIKRHEILFFKYYIDKAKENPAVEHYTTANEFPLYRLLLKEYSKYRSLDFFTKWGRYKNEYSVLNVGKQSV